MSPNINLLLMALGELLRYDIALRIFGFRRIHSALSGMIVRLPPRRPGVEEICAAVEHATALYWKPVRCLQRSVTMVRLLRRHGWDGRLVIGYRLLPFFSHAWVEIEGLVVGDSPAYKTRLRVLETV